jgi:hypothetical protein
VVSDALREAGRAVAALLVRVAAVGDTRHDRQREERGERKRCD